MMNLFSFSVFIYFDFVDVNEVIKLSYECDREETHPVHDIVLMQKSHTLQQHQHVAFDLSWGQGAISIPYYLR